MKTDALCIVFAELCGNTPARTMEVLHLTGPDQEDRIPERNAGHGHDLQKVRLIA